MFLQRHKFIVECRGSKKKYTFITERSKIAKYLCDLCSAQHKFNNEMNSRQLTQSLVSGQLLHDNYWWSQLLRCRAHLWTTLAVCFHLFFPFLPPEENIVQYAAVCRAQSSRLKSVSCSETPQDDSGLTTPQEESMTKLCDDVTARIEARIKQRNQILNEQRYVVI